MPWGTAQNRLRQLWLYELASRCDMLTCYKCKQHIGAPNELSMEHKLPWYNVDPDLFWDLDNLAFSHRKCNIPHKFYGQRSSRRGPNDTWLCKGPCEQYLPLDSFSLHSKSSHIVGIPRPHCKSEEHT